MIGFIKGEVISKRSNSIVINISQIGYEVHVGIRDFNVGDTVELYIHTQVKENDIVLWGMGSEEEIIVFRKLISISGIGGKTAINIISILGLEDFINHIANGTLSKIKLPGIGKKSLEKIALEFREYKFNLIVKQKNIESKEQSKISEVRSALETLGYKEKDIDKLVNSLSDDQIETLSTQAIIKLAFQNI